MGRRAGAALHGPQAQEPFAHAPERPPTRSPRDEERAERPDAATRQEVEARRKAFIRKWEDCHRRRQPKEAGDWLFTFTRLPSSQWRSARTTNAPSDRGVPARRPGDAQTSVLPSADTAAMLFWRRFASGQINMRSGRWPAHARCCKSIDQPTDLP